MNPNTANVSVRTTTEPCGCLPITTAPVETAGRQPEIRVVLAVLVFLDDRKMAMARSDLFVVRVHHNWFHILSSICKEAVDVLCCLAQPVTSCDSITAFELATSPFPGQTNVQY
jgi:hypothetical protein